MARGTKTSPLLLIVLAGLLLGGGYNYHRNWQAETAEPRPYEGYSQQDLEALLKAYQSENSALERRYESARSTAERTNRAGMLDENIRAFEQAQRRSSGSRALGAQLSMHQAATGEIEAELARRERDADPMQVHLRRLLTI